MPKAPARRTRERERALIRAARDGDRDAFCELLRPHLATLRSRTRGAVRTRPEVDADNVVQETLIRSFEALSLYDEQYEFAQYLFGIAKYTVRRHLSATGREVALLWDQSTDVAIDGSDALPIQTLGSAARALSGADRFPPPDQRTRARARLRELLEALLTYGGYPHQQVAFGYGTVLWGKPKATAIPPRGQASARQRPDKVPITSDPEGVVRELSDAPLHSAGRDFRAEIEAIEGLGSSELDRAFRAFDYRVRLVGRELFVNDRASERLLGHLADRVIGETELREYYGKTPQRSVADWIEAVKTRVGKYLAGEFDRNRCPLPMPEDFAEAVAPEYSRESPDNPGSRSVREHGRPCQPDR